MLKEHKENLLKLADKLETVPENQFHMDDYRVEPTEDGPGDSKGISDVLVNPDIDCGTSGCAIGWAPVVPGLEALEDDATWSGYAARVFGVCEWDADFAFMFSSSWKDKDNTPKGAAKRIRYFIEKGCPSNTDIEDMMTGKKELCYE